MRESVLTLLLVVLAAPLSAASSETVKTNYYVVTGSTGPELMRSLQQARPWRSQRDARTEWEVRYRYESISSADGCRVGELKIRTTVTITLPHWRYEQPPAPELAARWQRYMSALLRHEKEHENLGLAAGREAKRRMEALGEVDCAELNAVARRTHKEVIDEYRKRETLYDRRTRHGLTEGARF